jgi:deazaflavin-dependent oxidoreductase (nitroreductase family)
MEPDATPHYRQPDWFTRNVFNRLVNTFTRAGLSFRGSRVLEVRGRKSGLPRRVPVNLLKYSGAEYLVAPRGETEWVRNLRAAQGQLTLIKGRRHDSFAAIELGDEAKPELLRAYLAKWKFEVGVFFDGVGPDSSDAEVAAIAAKHPVFQLEPAATAR